MVMTKIDTKNNSVDMLMKVVPLAKFEHYWSLVMLMPLGASVLWGDGSLESRFFGAESAIALLMWWIMVGYSVISGWPRWGFVEIGYLLLGLWWHINVEQHHINARHSSE